LVDFGPVTDRDGILEKLEELKAVLPETFDTETAEDVSALEDLLDEISWADGCQPIVREDHFVQFAEDWASGLGPTKGWPYDCIDWERAADILRTDFRYISIFGQTYLIRS
jgi:hypothetical protein